MTEDNLQQQWHDIYDGLVLRAALCHHRGGLKRRGRKCTERLIVAYDDEKLAADIRVEHPRLSYERHRAYRISTGDQMATWFVRDGGEIGCFLEDKAILRIKSPEAAR